MKGAGYQPMGSFHVVTEPWLNEDSGMLNNKELPYA
jgi:hypothetical protein